MKSRFERAFRAFMPRGLLGRSLLIILLPLLILQGVALQIFYGSHLDVISRRMAAAVAGELGFVIELLQRDPSAEHRAWVFREVAWRFNMAMAFEQGATLGPLPERPASLPLLPLEGDLASAMNSAVGRPFDADWTSDPREPRFIQTVRHKGYVLRPGL